MSLVEESAQVTVKWRDKPVFIRHRTQAESDAARAAPLLALVDANARTGDAPEADAFDQNRTIDP